MDLKLLSPKFYWKYINVKMNFEKYPKAEFREYIEFVTKCISYHCKFKRCFEYVERDP